MVTQAAPKHLEHIHDRAPIAMPFDSPDTGRLAQVIERSTVLP